MKKEYKDQLSSLARIMSDSVISDLEDIIEDGKSDRALALISELSELKTQALVSSASDKRLYVEMIEDKLGSLEHILDSERIVASKAIATIFTRSVKTALAAFSSIGAELIKATVSGVIGGISGGLLGGLGDGLVDIATDALSPE